MPHYKDLQNKIYFLDNAKDAGFLPIGCTQITDAEAIILRTPAPLTIEQKRAQLQPLSPAQVRLVLDQFGLLTAVENAVAAGNAVLKIEWEFRTEFARDNATLLGMATALGITDAQLDQMFEIGIAL